jgi:predicted oxidoreductase
MNPPRTNPKGNARPIVTPPFYAAPGCVGITHTLGGVRIDAQARVLRKSGEPIPGLFAAGNIVGGLDGGPQPYYAGGLAQALIFGLLAAEAIAAERR